MVVLLPDGSLSHRDVFFVPAVLNHFDEILVNAVDNLRRDSAMRSVNVTVDAVQAVVSVRNDGR